jgi:large subunit ribosomal protein L14
MAMNKLLRGQSIVIVDQQGQPSGTRVFGPVLCELRKKPHVRILTLGELIA